MNWSLLTGRRSIDVPCVVEVENTFESLHAHVKLRNGIVVHPGDEVLVHGDPVEVPYGQRRVIERMATVTRAGWIERLWTRATGDLEFMELCEFSFSGSSKL